MLVICRQLIVNKELTTVKLLLLICVCICIGFVLVGLGVAWRGVAWAGGVGGRIRVCPAESYELWPVTCENVSRGPQMHRCWEICQPRAPPRDSPRSPPRAFLRAVSSVGHRRCRVNFCAQAIRVQGGSNSTRAARARHTTHTGGPEQNSKAARVPLSGWAPGFTQAVTQPLSHSVIQTFQPFSHMVSWLERWHGDTVARCGGNDSGKLQASQTCRIQSSLQIITVQMFQLVSFFDTTDFNQLIHSFTKLTQLLILQAILIK